MQLLLPGLIDCHVAHLVERMPEEHEAVGSIPTVATLNQRLGTARCLAEGHNLVGLRAVEEDSLQPLEGCGEKMGACRAAQPIWPWR